MESRNKILVKISVLIDKMSVISESLLADEMNEENPDIQVLMNYNEKLQNFLKSYNSSAGEDDVKLSAGSVLFTQGSDAPIAAPEDINQEIGISAPDIESIPDHIESQISSTANPIEDDIIIKDESVLQDIIEVNPIEPIKSVAQEESIPEVSEELISQEVREEEIEEVIPEEVEEEFVSQEVVEEVVAEEVREEIIPENEEEVAQEVNQLFPSEDKNIVESIESSEDVNQMYETQTAPDLNASFTEENTSVEEYAESIQDQIMNTIKDLGPSVSEKGGTIGGIAAAGAAAFGLNKMSQEPEEEIVEADIANTIEETIKDPIDSAPIVKESPDTINEELNTTDDSFFDFTEINLTESVSTEPEINDKFVSEVAAVEVSEKLKKSFAGDLKQNIDINDRFTFIQTLFNGDYGAFDSTIGSINKCNSYSDAVDLLEQKIITKYRWNEKEDVASQFIEIIRQKFI